MVAGQITDSSWRRHDTIQRANAKLLPLPMSPCQAIHNFSTHTRTHIQECGWLSWRHSFRNLAIQIELRTAFLCRMVLESRHARHRSASQPGRPVRCHLRPAPVRTYSTRSGRSRCTARNRWPIQLGQGIFRFSSAESLLAGPVSSR